ncbi:aromatic-L-amino-acid decarboxylase [Folsomia candida]|nr:aromatic-L-amino-acid decarboxylase [Folsomia candida]
MDSETFLKFGEAMLKYITEYTDNIRERRVLPTVSPGYLRPLIPSSPPDEGEPWQNIMADIERVIMPGVTHWNSPHFHAYYPTANSYPALVADMLSSAIGCVGFTWIASPSCTELEIVMMDWLGKMVHLPDKFLTVESRGVGGGMIQGTASEANLLTLLTARTRMVKYCKNNRKPGYDETTILGRLVAYASDQAHSSVERAGLLAGVKMNLIKTDDILEMRGDALKFAIRRDKAKGLIPFYVVATLGSTNTCAFDKLSEIGEVCAEEGVWLHVDAAYAGSAFICEEFRHLMNGVEFADSFNFNPHKWLLVNFDCSALWIANSKEIVDSFNVDPPCLRHASNGLIQDFRHREIPFGRRFRSLKLWFVMRIYGLKGLQEHIRGQTKLAHEFEKLVEKDARFELVAPVVMGLVCFRMKDKTNEENGKFLNAINGRGKIHLVSSHLHGKYIIRFAVCSTATASKDVAFAWKEIADVADQLGV